ncbi:hypothetical protein HD806DRAFT_511178 [Xylariaceae sp. AK1471]|nr:hypothetical protein HD806DRAFT_511178 [Xylariaceae sp. AK1471]
MADLSPTHSIYAPTSVGAVPVQEIENWFETDGLKLHRAYGEETHWLADQRRFVAGREPPIQKLKNMLVLYQIPASSAVAYTTGKNDLFNYSWDDVLIQLDVAKASCGTKDWKPPRKSDRLLANAASYGETWIDLIPDEYGLSIIRGGLALVFKTAAQKIENREKIIQTFEDLPDMIRTMETACKLFGSDEQEDVKGIAKSFYEELCSDIPDLIQILDGKSSRFKRALNRLAVGAPETSKIDEILERIARRTNKLEASIQRIKMILDAKAQSEIAAIRSASEATQVGVHLIHSELQQRPTRSEMDDFAWGLKKSIENTLREEIRSGVQEISKHQTQGDFAAEAKTFVFKMIQENESLKHQNAQLSAQNRQIEYERSREPSPVARPSISVLDLMRILDIDHHQWVEDLGFVLKQTARMSSENQGRARSLMRTRNFQNWMNGSRHSLLLVDGAMTLERVSPMSILTATLAVSMLQVPSVTAIYFFCGKNLDANAEDELSGPRGMLRSLITQLMMQITPSPNLSRINSHEFLHELYSRHFPTLCEVLRLLIEQLSPLTTLYCLIDGVSWYEQEHWVHELRFLLGLFRHLMSRPSGPYLKLLMTSSNRSTEVRDLINMEWEYVSLAGTTIDSMPLVSPDIIAAISSHF